MSAPHISARVIADSIPHLMSDDYETRLTTLEVTFPRFILAEFNTHRMLSRNSASSRAIPVEKRIQQVMTHPFVPLAFTQNKRGMQADEVLDERANLSAVAAWLRARDAAVKEAEALLDLGVHKQHANRILEPYAWHTVVVTATEWRNFFAQRCSKNAQPEMQETAHAMRAAIAGSTPEILRNGEWHLPYVDAEDLAAERQRLQESDEEIASLRVDPMRRLRALSVARCAAVSFDRQYAHRTMEDAMKRHDSLAAMAHWSPFEHQARCTTKPVLDKPAGNFSLPWLQYRKTFAGEDIYQGE